MRVVVGIASIPIRKKNLIKTIESLHDQVDEIVLCLNNYKEILDIHTTCDLRQIISDNSLGDAGKFMGMWDREQPVMYLSCDDDIIYPVDYADKMTFAARKHGGVVSLGGKVYRERSTHKKRDRLLNIHCKRGISDKDTLIHVPLTGVSCFRTDHVPITTKDFPEKNMADIHLGIFCEKNGIKRTAIARPPGWVGVQKVKGGSIFSGGRGTGKEGDYLYRIKWSKL